MPVTDEQVAPLRAQLAGNIEEYQRLFAQLDPASVRIGYRKLVSAAFCVAAERRFTSGTTVTNVMEFVGDARSRTDRMTAIDSRVAERVIRAVVSDEDIDDVDPRQSFEVQLLLLAAMTADARYDAAGLDEFLAESRILADQWIS